LRRPARVRLESRQADGHLLMLRAAWSSAGADVQRQFLTEVVGNLCLAALRAPKLDPPERTDLHRSDDECLSAFLDAHAIEGAHRREQASKILDRFNAWAESAGCVRWTSCRLASALKRRGLRSSRSRFVWWTGIALRSASAAPVPPP
jgi:hypothetical protein